MKYLVVSDLHGSEYYYDKLEAILKIEQPNKLIMLGDFFSQYNKNEKVYDFLERYRDIIVGIRGNCDFDYDNTIINLKDSLELFINDKRFFFTHGHKYSLSNIEKDIDVFVFGHLHTGFIKFKDHILSVNSGSLAFPRQGTINSYLVIDDISIKLMGIDNEIIDEFYFDWMWLYEKYR